MPEYDSVEEVLALIEARIGPVACQFVPEYHPAAVREAVEEAGDEEGLLIVDATTATLETIAGLVPPWRLLEARGCIAAGDKIAVLHLREETADAVPALDATLADLRMDVARPLVQALATSELENAAPSRDPFHRGLVALGLACSCGPDLVPSVGGLYAVGRRPSQRLAGLGIRLNAQPLRGDLRHMVGVAADAIAGEGVPRPVAEELIWNAVTHRSLGEGVLDEPTEIELLGPRVTIAAPADVQATTRELNPVLRAALRRLGLVPGRGVGVREADDALRKVGLPPAELMRRGHHIVTVVRCPGPLHRRRPPSADLAEPVHWSSTRNRRTSSADMRAEASSGRSDTPPPAPPAAREPDPAPEPEEWRMHFVSALHADPVRTAHQEVEGGGRRGRDQRVQDLVQALAGRVLTCRELQKALGWGRATTRAVVAEAVRRGVVSAVSDSVRSPIQRYSTGTPPI